MFQIDPLTDELIFLRESLENFLITAKTWFSVAHSFMYSTSSNYAVGNVFGGWCFLLISTIVLSNLEVHYEVIVQECAGALSQHTGVSIELQGKDPCSPSWVPSTGAGLLDSSCQFISSV